MESSPDISSRSPPEWLTALLPPQHALSPLFQPLMDCTFEGPQGSFQLSQTDSLLAQLVVRYLEESRSTPSRTYWNIRVPRGEHELLILLGLFAQYFRMATRYRLEKHCLAFDAPIVLIGKDTAVQRKLGALSIHGTRLDQGLRTYRIRSDGRLEAPGSSETIRFISGQWPLLYLNTRVGWPQLPKCTDGVALIDGTSFRSSKHYSRAREWRQKHHMEDALILSELASSDDAVDIQEAVEGKRCLPLTRRITETQTELSPNDNLSNQMSCRNLEISRDPVFHKTVHIANRSIVKSCNTIYEHLKAATQQLSEREGDELPRALYQARSLYYSLIRTASDLETYNRSAALSPRHETFRSRIRAIQQKSASDFSETWHRYANTRWTELKHALLDLYETLKTDNPKLMGLLDAIATLRGDTPNRRICIYTSSLLDSDALEEDLADFIHDLGGWERLEIQPWSTRRPWASTPYIGLSTGVPPPWYHSFLQSREVTKHWFLTYPFEEYMLRGFLREHQKTSDERLEAFFSAWCDSDIPPREYATQTERILTIEDDVLEDEESAAFSFDLEELLSDDTQAGEATFDEKISGQESPDHETRTNRSRRVVPFELEPDGTRWYVRADSSVEVLIGDEYRRLDPTKVREGQTVLVPRGETRSSLFERLVEAKEERDPDFQEVLLPKMDRWRRCCRRLQQKYNNDPQAVQNALSEAGATVTTQLDAWASGRTIAPKHDHDIRAVAKAADSPRLKKQWKTIRGIARELRSMHIKIGKRLSQALDELPSDGPNVRALTELLDMDPREIMDEFDRRVISERHATTEVPAQKAGTLQD